MFDRILAALAAESEATGTVRGQAARKGALSRCIGRTRGGLDSKLHAVCDADGKPLVPLPTEGRVSDYRGAATALPVPPDADTPIGDKGHDSDCFHGALARRRLKDGRRIATYDRTLC